MDKQTEKRLKLIEQRLDEQREFNEIVKNKLIELVTHYNKNCKAEKENHQFILGVLDKLITQNNIAAENFKIMDEGIKRLYNPSGYKK